MECLKSVLHVKAAFNQEKAIVQSLLCDYTTSNFANVHLKLYFHASSPTSPRLAGCCNAKAEACCHQQPGDSFGNGEMNGN